MTNLSKIGFELWTMQNNVLFDNIYIGHSVEEAETLKKETFDLKIVAEKAEEAASEPKIDEDKPSSPTDLNFKEDPVKYIREKVELFITLAKKDPLEAAKVVPEVAGAFALTALTLIALILTSLSPAAPTQQQVKDAAKKTKGAATDAKDKAAEAVTTGAEKAQAEVQRRSGRLSSNS
jgi:calnexin